MKKRQLVGWALATALTIPAFSALAQLDEGPILHPKSTTVKSAGATLLVICDLSCNWTLDGEAKGSIEAGGSAKAKVEPGQHLIVAMTADGMDQVQQSAKVEARKQSIASIDLQPVRDARLKVEQNAREKQALEQLEEERREQEQAAKDQEAKAQKDREQVAREETARKAELLYKDERYTEAIPLLEGSCTGGSANACERLGSMYEDGKGVTKDYYRAFALYGKACDAGSAGGCNSLGGLYDIGRGASRHDNKAVTLYSKACEEGSADGCTNLGTMYLAGRGVGMFSKDADPFGADCKSICDEAKDYPKALTLFSKACDTGSADGCFYLGSMYSEAYGVTEDESMALTLFTKACDAGSGRGCYVAGIYYRTGNYVLKDKPRAQQFLSRGCSLGSDLACDALKMKR
jgi:TPR repeat protein